MTPQDPRFTLLIQDMRSVTGTIPASAAWKWAVHLQQLIDSRAVPLGAAQDVQRLINEQAEDAGLWFTASTAPEAYLQVALRRLHAVVEGALPPVPVEPAARVEAPANLRAVIDALPRIRPAYLDGEELEQRNGEYVNLDDLRDALFASPVVEPAAPQDSEAILAGCAECGWNDEHSPQCRHAGEPAPAARSVYFRRGYLIERLEYVYNFQCDGGPLRNCTEWQQLKALISPAACGAANKEPTYTATERDNELDVRDAELASEASAAVRPDFNPNYTQCSECGGTFQHYAPCQFAAVRPPEQKA